MTVQLTATIISFVVAVLWLGLLYRLDKYDKEPKKLMLKVFLGGALFSYLAMFLNTTTLKMYGLGGSLAFVGFVEEAVKFLPVLLIAYKSKFFNEPLDGLFYAGVSALGFAFMENISYNKMILQNYHDSKTVVLALRGMTPFLHVLLSSFWGYILGLYKRGSVGAVALFFAYLFSAILHSGYDLFVSSVPFLILFTYLLLGSLFFLRVKHLNRLSPHNDTYLIECKRCKTKVRENTLFCSECGKKLFFISSYRIYCPSCQNQVFRKWKFCKSCGERFV